MHGKFPARPDAIQLQVSSNRLRGLREEDKSAIVEESIQADGSLSTGLVNMSLDDIFPGSKKRVTEWGKLHGTCWICGTDWNLQTHHIERRAICYRDWGDVECNLFRTCGLCHDDKLAAMPHSIQLAYKSFYDPDTVDLQAWLHCRDGPFVRSGSRVTADEIGDALHLLGLT